VRVLMDCTHAVPAAPWVRTRCRSDTRGESADRRGEPRDLVV
jgi:hypothetical protein